ncbi:MAG: S8 family serine peptidase [Candidatus Lokiarchaeota archaeon]|nr:S8 family serine peptidase [Candidatus Lokiarchaeota archaeon]
MLHSNHFTSGLIEYLEQNEDIKQIELFLVFELTENLTKFELEQKIRKNGIKILYRFTILPILFVRCDKTDITYLSSLNIIQTIDINYRCYLSHVSQEKGNFEKSTRIHTVKNKKKLGSGLKIALIDTGIDQNHPIFRRNKISKIDITNETWDDIIGHGTLIAGIVAKYLPKSEIIDVKIVKKSGLIFASDVLFGLEQIYWKRFDILLFGCSSPTPSDGDDVLSQACRKFVENGISIVIPAGNFGPEKNTLGFSAEIPKSYCIGSLSPSNKISFFSSRNIKKPDYYIKGENMNSAISFHGILGNQASARSHYRIFSGTSVSAAKFVAIWGMIKNCFPEYDYNQMQKLLCNFSSNTRFLEIKKIYEQILGSQPNMGVFLKNAIMASIITAIFGALGICAIIFL